jgi:hypothetical protein
LKSYVILAWTEDYILDWIGEYYSGLDLKVYIFRPGVENIVLDWIG